MHPGRNRRQRNYQEAGDKHGIISPGFVRTNFVVGIRNAEGRAQLEKS